MKKFRRQHLLRSAIITWSLSGFICLLGISAFAQTIVDEWNSIKVPPAPELKPVTIDPKVTALLILDFNKQTCNAERKPRCINSIPKVQRLLTEARTKGVPVTYSITIGAAPGDIAKELAPLGGEPVVVAGMDKFMGTDLEKILKEKGIKIVIITGTSSHGAVLNTQRAEPYIEG